MPDVSAAECQRLKLEKLIEIEGFASIENLLGATIADSVSPAICTNSMKSALLLVGII
jgi:hypothetical protein